MGNNFNLGLGDADDSGSLGADVEQALGAGVNRDAAVGRPHGGGHVRLDIALVHGLGVKFPFDDDVCLGKALLNVANLVLDMSGDVALDARCRRRERTAPCGSRWSCPRGAKARLRP